MAEMFELNEQPSNVDQQSHSSEKCVASALVRVCSTCHPLSPIVATNLMQKDHTEVEVTYDRSLEQRSVEEMEDETTYDFVAG